ncbi:unnamed protein product [Orchesella dallaii]|uniref:Uncharacterized protein n=1 Tax=Orchesella dallaii TaxID=48710 RepID=A0ABP1R3Z7_9HEXA
MCYRQFFLTVALQEPFVCIYIHKNDLYSRVLTTKGLNEETAYEATYINGKWLDTIPAVDVHSDAPNNDLQDAAGDDYMTDVEMKLALRKLLQTNIKALSGRERRWIMKVIKPALRVAKKLVDATELGTLFNSLFTGDNGILKTIAAYRVASPNDRKAFTDLSKKVSEFETETKKLFIDVLRRTDGVEKDINKLQADHYELANHVMGFEGMVLMQQSQIADLQHKLRDLELRMPNDMELVYGSTEAARGLLKIGVPLKKKRAAYQIFEYRPIQFAHYDYTCSLDTPATIVIKEFNTNDVFSITELEMETCQLSTGLCLLPLDLMPLDDGGQDVTVFSNVEEIINQHYDPEIGSTAPEPDIASTLIESARGIWEIIQTLVILYIFFKGRYVRGAVVAQANRMIQMAEAAEDKYTCRLPTDVYIMLWSILICSALALVPGLIIKVYKFIKNQWNDTLDLAAASRPLICCSLNNNA